MRIDILTLFPDMIKAVMTESITGRALANNIFELGVTNIRDFAENKHNRVDDYPYGGGNGMVMMARPVCLAYEHVKTKDSRLIFMSPKGKTFNQEMAKELSKEKHLVFLCGHYEGIDQRALDILNPEEISIGDFILTGGEQAVIPVCDSILRLVPGVLGNEESKDEESFENNLLEYPQYTRPPEIFGLKVPEVLLSGHHKNIMDWKRKESIKETLKKRPDLINYENLTDEERKFIGENIKKF